MDVTEDLVRFLRERLDEDERVARAASPGPWSPNAESDEVVAVDGITVADGFALSGRQLRATVEHIARHDPARVLREVEAKRQILGMVLAMRHFYFDEDTWFSCGLATDSSDPDAEPGSGCANDDRVGECTCGLAAKQTRWLMPLVLPYDSHPDFRPEWRP